LTGLEEIFDELNGGADGTIFATFSCHHRQKRSVSCNGYVKGPNPLMPKNVTTELMVTVRKGTCFIREKHETRHSALLVSSEKIIARDAGLGADCA
jgi:hypothetical protein